METFSTESVKPSSKRSQIIPSAYHVKDPKYAGVVSIGSVYHYTEWFDDKEEVQLELRCLEKRLSYEVIETVEGEGFYPERAKLMEDKYQASGRTNGLYTGLMLKDGTVSDNTAS